MKPNKLYLPKKFYDDFMAAKFTIDAPIYHDGFNESNVEFVEKFSWWHSTDEEPQEKYASIYLLDKKREIHNLLFLKGINDWKLFCKGYNAIAWCYISDMIQTKGGVK